MTVNEKNILKLLERISRSIGYCWAAIGFFIVVFSNAIILGGLNFKFWFIPIDTRDHVLTALLLLVPVVLIFVGILIKKMLLSKEAKVG